MRRLHRSKTKTFAGACGIRQLIPHVTHTGFATTGKRRTAPGYIDSYSRHLFLSLSQISCIDMELDHPPRHRVGRQPVF
jgi:hypothetical protein